MDDDNGNEFSSEEDVGGMEFHHQNVVRPGQQQRWKTGLFECGQDYCKSFCLSTWIPCLPFACIADIVDQGENSTCLHCCFYILGGSMYAGWYRKKLRARYGLPEEPLPDRITHVFCHSCALAQEYRELTIRGFSVLKGWNGGPKKTTALPQHPQGAPPVQRPMTRQAPAA